MKYFFLIIFCLFLSSCTVIRIYSGNEPYFLQETNIVFDSDTIRHDSIKIVNNNTLLIIKDDHIYDILDHKVK